MSAGFQPPSPVQIPYAPEIEAEIVHLSAAAQKVPALALYNPRWLAIQLLEGDSALLAETQTLANGNFSRALADSLARLGDIYGEELDVALADTRYRFVNNVARSVVSRPAENALTPSDKIDRIVTHRWLGIPIFLLLMWVVFKITTDVATPYLDWVDWLIHGPITGWVLALLNLIVLGGSWVESLLVDGVIAGVGGVLVFVPVLMSLYFALAILEDTGYMARGAFVMDRLMNKLGLHGKSFLPMVVGFGCTVPALYATRTLDSEKDRILTALLVPFMSCGARLPVYVLFATIFFPRYTGVVILGLYLLGVVVAVSLGLLLKNTLFKEKEMSTFVMELPAYRTPNLKNIWFYVWKRTSAFLHNAWTIILGMSVLIWLLMAIPLKGGSFAHTPLNDSAFAGVSRALSPAFAPMGFDSWEAGGALLTGIVAKEVVISTMGQVYHVVTAEEESAEPAHFINDCLAIGREFVIATLNTLKSIPLIVGINLFDSVEETEPTALAATVRANFAQTSHGHGSAAALAFMVFVLLYTPCAATIAVERKELGLKWTLVSVFGQFALAWLVSGLAFQAAKLLGL